MVDPRSEELLRRLALNDEPALESVLQMSLAHVTDRGLDAKSHALVRFAALVALRSSGASYEWSVAEAHAAGASDEEVVGVLVSLLPLVGVAA